MARSRHLAGVAVVLQSVEVTPMLRQWLIKHLSEAETPTSTVIPLKAPAAASARDVPTQPRLLRSALTRPKSVCTSLKDLCEL